MKSDKDRIEAIKRMGAIYNALILSCSEASNAFNNFYLAIKTIKINTKTIK